MFNSKVMAPSAISSRPVFKCFWLLSHNPFPLHSFISIRISFFFGWMFLNLTNLKTRIFLINSFLINSFFQAQLKANLKENKRGKVYKIKYKWCSTIYDSKDSKLNNFTVFGPDIFSSDAKLGVFVFLKYFQSLRTTSTQCFYELVSYKIEYKNERESNSKP